MYQFNLMAGTKPVLISGGFTTFRVNSVFQWRLLIFCVLSYLFIVITVVDILRNRPQWYGAWLAAAFAFISLQIQIVPGNFHVGGGVYGLVVSAFKVYSTGARNLVVGFPAGALVYWRMRKKMLAK